MWSEFRRNLLENKWRGWLGKFWEKLALSKRPKEKNYKTITDVVKDNLIIGKLNFFSFVASILQPFLTKYQSDNLLVPFMYDGIVDLAKSLMRIIIKTEKNRWCCGEKLQGLWINLGCAAANSIFDLKCQDQF